MALPTAAALEEASTWTAAQHVAALPEMWALFAEHGDGLVGAWRLMRVCKAERVGAKEYLRTLPGLVVCGGVGAGTSDVWRLELATMRWEPMPALVTGRYDHACCAVRGALVVLGGSTMAGPDGRTSSTSSVEMVSSSVQGAFVDLPPLSCGRIAGAAAIAVEESDSAAGQVVLLGGPGEDYMPVSTVQLVDLATGACAQQPGLLHSRLYPAAGRLPDGRVVCAGGIGGAQSAEVWGPPEQGGAEAAWSWTERPAMSAGRFACCGCVMSDGRFAVLGGCAWGINGVPTSSCEALAFDDGVAHWVLCRPCTTRGNTSHAGLSPGASVSPVGSARSRLDQLKCTMRSAIGGFGFLTTYLSPFGTLAAHFCRRPGSVIRMAP
jgi:hypothetical protein